MPLKKKHKLLWYKNEEEYEIKYNKIKSMKQQKQLECVRL